MPTPAIVKGSDHFYGTIYEGNGGGQKVGRFVPFTDSGTISNSCLFETANNDNLSKTYGGAGTSQQTATISAWVKRCKTGNDFQTIFGVGSDAFKLAFNSGTYSDAIQMYYYTGSYVIRAITKRTFEDTSKWYHIVFILDLSNSTQGDRWRLYVDGDRITEFESGYETYPGNTTTTTNVGAAATYYVGKDHSTASFDGYIAELNYIDGTAYEPSNFGLTDTSTGRWIPKTLTGLSYGTNGVRLQFGTSSAMGDDTSGNENDYSLTGIDATNQTTDSPTQNYPIMDSLKTAMTLSKGNTIGTSPGTGIKFAYTQMTFDPSDSTGYYVEFKLLQATYSVCGFRRDDKTITTTQGYTTEGHLGINYVRSLWQDGVEVYAPGSTFSNNDVVGFYIKDSKLYWSLNGTMQNSSNHIGTFKPGRYRLMFGHNANYTPLASIEMICPQSKWNHTPSGAFANYREIQQDNLPDTGLGVPDIVWFNNRDSTDSNSWYDSNRGPLKALYTDTNAAETTVNDGLQKFIKGGCEIEDDAAVNSTGESFINWNWVVNGGTTETNDDGSTDVTLQKNVTAGISIGTFKSTSGAQTLGHGLGVAPDAIIMKCTSTSQNWMVYHKDLDPTDSHYLHLNNYDTEQTGSDFNNTLPTSTVFSANPTGTADRDYIFYAFKGIPGFSKFGTYTGNGVANGPFIHLGFKPRWFMHKANNGAAWYIYDSIRENNYNEILYATYANVTTAESTNVYGYDFLSNGVKVRNPTGYGGNYSGVEVFYFAFAEHPFIGDGVSPATAF